MILNRSQLIALWVGIVIAVLALLYPVSDYKANYVGEPDFSAAHIYLFAAPLQPLDIGRTILQLLVVILITTGAIVSLKQPFPKSIAKPSSEIAPVIISNVP